ncbi:putative transporter ADD1 (major facilitator superfamily) [Handroanthus impetiginosus]|uniref:Putative transporter ADD1 (Major facilitator superfamily) n=1 Tax=Handroanthus impetiginosus TaxID=429701 RepID=A0A2G9GW47_9LAMI|nr:putative transporter ADD1 (major facilitator superfamily) [Handroanthus impetiginosus]
MENWGRLSHLFVTLLLYYFCDLMVNPKIPDVTLAAVCPGEEECSAAIYLSGFQQAIFKCSLIYFYEMQIGGIGSVIMMPLMGNLSNAYGRKILMMIPLVLAIFSHAVLAWRRTISFFYAYYVIKTLTQMVTQSGYLCLALAHLADNMSEGKRVSAFGVLSGVLYAAFVAGTLAGRLISTNHIFLVFLRAAIYTMIFLKETTRQTGPLKQPILKVIENNEDSCESSNKNDFIGKIPSPQDIFRLQRSSVTFSLAASVAFFNSVAECGFQYFLKARFHYSKDQCADICCSLPTLEQLYPTLNLTTLQMLFMPTLGPRIGEEILLSLGLLARFLSMFFDSIAWAAWVPYASSSMGFFSFPSESNSLFLFHRAPFHFQGLSVLCIGLARLAGFFMSIMIPILSRNSVQA